MSNSQVASKFANRNQNKRGLVEYKGSNMFCERDIIYSYGYHFPMAKHLGVRDHEEFFVLNSDRYSSSTSRHQSYVRYNCSGPSLSRQMLRKYGRFEDLTIDNIILWQKGEMNTLWKDKETGKFYSDYDVLLLSIDDSLPSGPYEVVKEDDESFDLVKLSRSYGVFKNEVPAPKKFGINKRQEWDRFIRGSSSCEEIVVLNFGGKYLASINSRIIELNSLPSTIDEIFLVAAA